MNTLQGNLKSTIVVYSSDSLPVPAETPGDSLHQLQEDRALQHLFQASEDVAPLRHRPQLFLSFLPVLIQYISADFYTNSDSVF